MTKPRGQLLHRIVVGIVCYNNVHEFISPHNPIYIIPGSRAGAAQAHSSLAYLLLG